MATHVERTVFLKDKFLIKKKKKNDVCEIYQ